MPARVLVLDVPLSDTASLDAFAEALHAAAPLAGAPFAHAGEDAHAGAEAQRFAAPTGATVELVDDRDADARYVEVLDRDEARAAALLDHFRAALPVAPPERLLADARARCGEAPATLLRLALGSPLPPDQPTVEAIRAALGHEAARVRLAAVEAVGLVGLRPFVRELDALRKADPNNAVREYAEQTVRLLHG